MSTETVGVAVLDINMPELDGLALQQQLRQRCPCLGLIFLTGYGAIAKAVEALQAGAFDFLEKPVAPAKLLSAIERAQCWAKKTAQHVTHELALQQKLAQLTEREMQLLPLVAAGKANKLISYELHLAQRTVEIHRHNLFAKMGGSQCNRVGLNAERQLSTINLTISR